MAFVLVAATLPATPTRVAALQCGDVHIVWARGSGQDTGADIGFTSFVERDMGARIGPEVAVTSYDLGTGMGYGGFDYPAVAEESPEQVVDALR